MNLYQKVLCDHHPRQVMEYFKLSNRLTGEDGDVFKCPQCPRIYLFTGDHGYSNFVNGRLDCDPDQFTCKTHNAPLFLESFEFNGDASRRTWKCPYDGCAEEKITIGEPAAKIGRAS